MRCVEHHSQYFGLNALYDLVRMRDIPDKSCTENHNKFVPLKKFFTKFCGLYDTVENNVEQERPQRVLRGG